VLFEFLNHIAQVYLSGVMSPLWIYMLPIMLL
jgi:hypothetical protein